MPRGVGSDQCGDGQTGGPVNASTRRCCTVRLLAPAPVATRRAGALPVLVQVDDVGVGTQGENTVLLRGTSLDAVRQRQTVRNLQTDRLGLVLNAVETAQAVERWRPFADGQGHERTVPPTLAVEAGLIGHVPFAEELGTLVAGVVGGITRTALHHNAAIQCADQIEGFLIQLLFAAEQVALSTHQDAGAPVAVVPASGLLVIALGALTVVTLVGSKRHGGTLRPDVLLHVASRMEEGEGEKAIGHSDIHTCSFGPRSFTRLSGCCDYRN